MPASAVEPPPFTALLFGLCGDLVDFGAQTLPQALQRLFPHVAPQRIAEATAHPPRQALTHLLGREPNAEECANFLAELRDSAGEQAQAVPEALETLHRLAHSDIPCIWLDELPPAARERLAKPLNGAIVGSTGAEARPWPAPDACWQALITLGSPQLDGCVLVSSQPRLLQSGLNAGLWTIGLAARGPHCGLSAQEWDALEPSAREQRRAQATLQLYRLGVHSVIDHLGELEPCLRDIACRRAKGEKP